MHALCYIMDIEESSIEIFDQRVEKMCDTLGVDYENYWEELRCELRDKKMYEIDINTMYRDLFGFAASVLEKKYGVDEDSIDWYINDTDSYFMIDTEELEYEKDFCDIEEFLMKNKVKSFVLDESEEEEEE